MAKGGYRKCHKAYGKQGGDIDWINFHNDGSFCEIPLAAAWRWITLSIKSQEAVFVSGAQRPCRQVGNLFVALLVMDPAFQELGSPDALRGWR
jgi:hypothetical protein